LTVDPKKRLTMAELQGNEWVRGAPQVLSARPLVTPDVLSHHTGSLSRTHTQLHATIHAFHEAERRGFRLQDVGNAPLARRRKMKKSSESSSSSRSSSNSSMSSAGSLTPTKGSTSSLAGSSPARNHSSASSSSAASMGFVPRTTQQNPLVENSGYFSFRESRIAALLPSMSTLTEATAAATAAANAASSSTSSSLKRKLQPTAEEQEEEDDDDCIIVGEELGTAANTISDAVNNNGKRRRMDTIVIE
jgi:hypothetical protein